MQTNMMKNFFLWFGLYILLTVIIFTGMYILFLTNHTKSMKQTRHISVSQANPTPPLASQSGQTISMQVSEQEKQQIDIWIKQNHLDQYGNPQGTMYPGGTPLFNEATGKTQDKYDYIIERHPDQPWTK